MYNICKHNSRLLYNTRKPSRPVKMRQRVGWGPRAVVYRPLGWMNVMLIWHWRRVYKRVVVLRRQSAPRQQTAAMNAVERSYVELDVIGAPFQHGQVCKLH